MWANKSRVQSGGAGFGSMSGLSPGSSGRRAEPVFVDPQSWRCALPLPPRAPRGRRNDALGS